MEPMLYLILSCWSSGKIKAIKKGNNHYLVFPFVARRGIEPLFPE